MKAYVIRLAPSAAAGDLHPNLLLDEDKMPQDSFETIDEIESEPDVVIVRFSGAALTTLADLRQRLGAATPEEAVLRGVQLLASARDKDVLLRRGDTIEVVPLWKNP